MYRISSHWWCKRLVRGGHCKIRCKKLLNDDISDDVKCAVKILSRNGIAAWKQNENTCYKYKRIVDSCLPPINTPKKPAVAASKYTTQSYVETEPYEMNYDNDYGSNVGTHENSALKNNSGHAGASANMLETTLQ
jgi:hypothetical protein